MKIKAFSGGVFLSLLTAKLFAITPTALQYQNQPIDSLCFFNTENDKGVIDLKKCLMAKEKYRPKGSNSQLLNKGYIGYDWQDKQSPDSGYSYYKFFQAGKGQYWLYTINNTGGSGEFSALSLVKRTGPEHLDIKTLISGDRCNGGVQMLSEESKQLRYSVNLTAYDFIKLSNKSFPKLQAYDDLAACAVCCVAKAVYELSEDKPPQLQYINLEKFQTKDEMPQQGNHQSCFNKLFTPLSAEKTQIKPNQLDEFAGQFSKLCLNIE